ncbi:MAG: glutathione S-transferase family protein [Alphaproteobacteria bacterium]|nr:glutathione S-transferase family protein [Alphaproteobacteria bacterium]
MAARTVRRGFRSDMPPVYSVGMPSTTYTPKLRMLATGSSPYATRCRMAFYAKGVSVDLFPPPDGLGSQAYISLHPFVKVPTLWIDDGTVLQESMAILEWIDDAFPEPPLKPADPALRARMRMIAQLADQSIMSHLMTMFPHRDLKVRDAAVVARGLDGIADGFDRLEHHLPARGLAAGDVLTLADCVAMPIFYLVLDFMPHFGGVSPLETRPKCAGYWQRLLDQSLVKRIYAEMAEHLAAQRAARFAREVTARL